MNQPNPLYSNHQLEQKTKNDKVVPNIIRKQNGGNQEQASSLFQRDCNIINMLQERSAAPMLQNNQNIQNSLIRNVEPRKWKSTNNSDVEDLSEVNQLKTEHAEGPQPEQDAEISIQMQDQESAQDHVMETDDIEQVQPIKEKDEFEKLKGNLFYLVFKITVNIIQISYLLVPI